MASERGAANIRKFNSEREEKNLGLVKTALQLCKKRKLQFRSAGLLAAYLSDFTSIHRTTLARNAKYRALLAAYLRSQPGAAVIVDDETNDPYVLKAKLAAAQAEVGSLRQEMKRLTAQLSRPSAVMQHASGTGKNEVDVSNLCVLLCLVLVRAETFAVDLKSRILVDLAARPSERLVGGSERVGVFVAWMDQNASLPFVKDVKRI